MNRGQPHETKVSSGQKKNKGILVAHILNASNIKADAEVPPQPNHHIHTKAQPKTTSKATPAPGLTIEPNPTC